jgi:preprotein translocase subunit SecG
VTPTTLAINAGQFGLALLLVFFLIISLVMILIVLVQRPQGGGLSGAFGGSAAGSSQTAFGARTGDVLTLVTIGIFVIFLVTAVALNYMVGPPAPVNPTAGGANGAPPPATTAPATTPLGDGGEQPTEQPATTEETGETTTPAEQPAEQPTEPPAETPTETPTETPSEPPAQGRPS